MAGIQIIYRGKDYKDFSKKTYFKIYNSLKKIRGTEITIDTPVLHQGYEEINCHFSGAIVDKSKLIGKLKKAIEEVKAIEESKGIKKAERINLNKLEIDTIRDR